MNDVLVWSVLGLAGLNAGLLLWMVTRRSDQPGGQVAEQGRRDLLAAVQTNTERLDRLERELRREISESSRGGRQELTQNLAIFQRSLVQQGAEATRTQNTQIDAFGQQLALLQKRIITRKPCQICGQKTDDEIGNAFALQPPVTEACQNIG